MTYEALLQAIEVFGLDRRATLAQIKARHRQLVKKHHPNRGSDDLDTIRRINAAHKTLTAYCKGDHYCFTEEEFLEQLPEERLRHQFAGDPVWGDNKNS